MKRAIACVLLMCALVIPAALLAATQNAVVYGTVYDSAGNPMAGVTVTLENPALGFTRATTTGTDGSYNFAEVPPAEGYKLTAAKGAKKLDIRAGITVNVGDERVILPPLKEQAVAAAPVEKTAEGQAVRTETVSTTMSGVITGDQLRSLPSTVNRNFLSLGTLTPNTHDVEGGSELAGASFSIAGTRPSTNNFLLDGSDNVASSSNQAVPFQVNDAIQEFRVTSSTASAEYGRNQGGVVNVVTRRGGNAFHGSVFGYFNNDAFNADNPLSVYNGTTFDKAAAYAGPVTATCASSGAFPLTYNEYVDTACFNGFFTDGLGTGGTPANTLFDPAAVLAANNRFQQPFDSKQFGVNMGGALIKDKWFLFGSYEATLIDNPKQIFERVPSGFDRTFDPLGAGYTFASGLGAADPDYRIASRVMALFPAPNVIAVPDALEFYRGEAPNHTTVHNILVRSDYVHSEKTSFTARYAAQWLNQLHDATLPEQANYPGNGAFRDAFNQNLSLSYTRTFSPTLINELRVGFNRFQVEEKPQDAGFDPGTLGLEAASMPTILLNGLDPQYSGAVPGTNGAYGGWIDSVFMRPSTDYLFPMARLGAPLGAPSERRDTTWFAADSVSWSHGKHAVRFGLEFRHLANKVNNGGFSRGFVYAADMGAFTSDSENCNQLCGASVNAFLHPSFTFAQAQSTPYVGNFHSYAFSGFIQDTWRFHPRWTLNVGVRYEYFSPPEEADDRIWNFDPASNGLVQQGHSTTIDQFGIPCSSPSTTYDALAPAYSGFLIIPGAWVCDPVGSGKIVRSDTNNFAPRAGLAWDVFGSGKTVLRFGIGWFYDQLPISYTSQLLLNRPTSAASNPNSVYGQVDDFGLGFCPITICATGNTFLNPTTQGTLSFDGVNPNSFYTVAASPFAIYARDVEHSGTPYTRQISASWQQQITNKLVLELGYVGTSGKQLPVVFDNNFTNHWTVVTSGGVGNQVGGNITFSPAYTMTNQADSTYHSLLARARVAEFHGLRMNVTYNWSKGIDNASTGFFPTVPVTAPDLTIGYQLFGTGNPITGCIYFGVGCGVYPTTFPVIDFSTAAVTTTGQGQVLTSRYLIPQDPYHFLGDERGRSDFDSKHRFVLDYTWDVPSLQKKWGWSKWLDYWQFSGVFVAQSGQPFSIFAGPILGELTERANVLGPVTQDNGNPNAAISTANLALPQSTPLCSVTAFPFISPFLPAAETPCTGNSRRNQFTGPNLINFNMAVQKGFPVGGENRLLTIRAEFYNLANRANYYNPISALSVDGFNLNSDFGKIKSAHDPRQIQFALRYTW